MPGMRNSTLDVAIWVLIYGGLLFVCLGIFVQRNAQTLGWTLVGGGAAVTAIGAAGIWLRARREPAPTKKEETR